MSRKANHTLLIFICLGIFIACSLLTDHRQTASEKEYELLKYTSHTQKDYSSFSDELTMLSEDIERLEKETASFLRKMNKN